MQAIEESRYISAHKAIEEAERELLSSRWDNGRFIHPSLLGPEAAEFMRRQRVILAERGISHDEYYSWAEAWESSSDED